MYIKPTKEGIESAMEHRWSREEAERGYSIFEFKNTGMLEIERIDYCYCGLDEKSAEVDDEDCAIEAEKSGFCKIIPIDELPENLDRRYFGWIDTPDNRKAIEDYCMKMKRRA